MNEKMLTKTANDRINYIFRDLIGDELDIDEESKKQNRGYKFAAMMALDRNNL